MEVAIEKRDWDTAWLRYQEMEGGFDDELDVRLAKAHLLSRQEKGDAVSRFSELTVGLDKFPDPLQRADFYWQLANICLKVAAYEECLYYGREATMLMPKDLRVRLFMLDVARVASNVEESKTARG